MFVGLVLFLLLGCTWSPSLGVSGSSSNGLWKEGGGLGGMRHGGCPISTPHSRLSLTAALLLWPRLPHGSVFAHRVGAAATFAGVLRPPGLLPVVGQVLAVAAPLSYPHPLCLRSLLPVENRTKQAPYTVQDPTVSSGAQPQDSIVCPKPAVHSFPQIRFRPIAQLEPKRDRHKAVGSPSIIF